MSRSFLNRGGGWVIAQTAFMALVLSTGPAFQGQWGVGSACNLIGWTLLFIGAAFGISGFLTLGPNTTPFPQPREESTLVTHGVYSIVRHPLYSSLIFLSFGWGTLWMSLPSLVSAALFSFFLNIKACHEEAWLRRKFAEYEEYARRVPRFIPWRVGHRGRGPHQGRPHG